MQYQIGYACFKFQESGKEEIKEVSATLQKLKKEYDDMHKRVLQSQVEQERLRKKLDDTTRDEQLAEAEAIMMKERLEYAQNLLKDTKRKHDIKLMEQQSYYHMINRMKQDMISMTLETNDLGASLKEKKAIAKDEFEKA